MNRTATLAVALVAVAGMGVASGCRVERTRGQRHQVRTLQSILETETQRLERLDPNSDPAGVTAEYRSLMGMYQELLDTTVRSAWAEPTSVQQAEDRLMLLADNVRGTPTYQAFNPDTKVNFERQFWRNRLQPWQQWRGPGWQVKREQWEELKVGKPAGY